MGEDGARVPEPVIESLRWLWWQRDSSTCLSGESRTLAQSLQMVYVRGFTAKPVARDATLSAAGALFHQRALGEVVHVRVLAPGSDAGIALARTLLDAGARPYAGAKPPADWTLTDEGFATWLVASGLHGARIVADTTLNPKPLRGVTVQLDVGCLPARLREMHEGSDAIAHPELSAALETILDEPPAIDEVNGHALVPATRIVDVEEGLRAQGATVDYRRLAPPGQRFLEWVAELPEDLHGARPRLRAHFKGPLTKEPPGLRPTTILADYQREAVAFILHHRHTCLLADDMGLGKTIESLAAAQFVPGRVLVVAPASAREVWRREVDTFTLERAVVIGPGDDPEAVLAEDAKYVVTGYSNLEALAPFLTDANFGLVILDESHYVKNVASGRARLVRERLMPIPRRLVVSGTPVMNSPDEMRGQLLFLHPLEWSDGDWFQRRFVDPFEEGTDEVRAEIIKRLRQFLEGVMIRREKATALPDLPPKTITWHRVSLPQEATRAYVSLEEEFEAFVRTEGVACIQTAKATGKLERLKQAALAGKLPEALRFLRSVLDGGEKVVVFSRYRNVLRSVSKDLAEYGPVVLSGDTSPDDRAEAARRFQEDDDCRLFVGQLVAAGTAITLIAGTHAVFLDLDWNPANHRQAMDRIHRRGQMRPVTAHFFLASGTVDEDIAEALDAKGRMMDALLSPTHSPPGDVRGAKRTVVERILARRGVSATLSTDGNVDEDGVMAKGERERGDGEGVDAELDVADDSE